MKKVRRASINYKHNFPVNKNINGPEPGTKPDNFVTSFADFTGNHKGVVRQLQALLMHLKANTQYLEASVLEKDSTIEELKKEIDAKEEKISKGNEIQSQVRTENDNLKSQLAAFKKKYSDLEICYEASFVEMTKKKEQLEVNVATQQKLITRSKEEFDAIRKELQDKLDLNTKELSARDKMLSEMQDAFEADKQNVADLQNAFNEYKLQIYQQNMKELEEQKVKLADLQAELQRKDEIIANIQSQKDDLEKAKNKIIDEQSFKMREIERVFGQPVSSVQRISSGPSTQQTIAPLQNTQKIASSMTSVTSAAKPRGLAMKRPIHSSPPPLNRLRSTSSRQAISSYIPTEDFGSSSDEDMSITRWAPNIFKDANEDTPPTGFVLRRRLANDIYASPTSESDQAVEAKRINLK